MQAPEESVRATGKAVGSTTFRALCLRKSFHLLKTSCTQQQNGVENGLLIGVWRGERDGAHVCLAVPCFGYIVPS